MSLGFQEYMSWTVQRQENDKLGGITGIHELCNRTMLEAICANVLCYKCSSSGLHLANNFSPHRLQRQIASPTLHPGATPSAHVNKRCAFSSMCAACGRQPP